MQKLHTFFSTTLFRWLLFIAAFVFISGTAGSWLISTKTLLFPFYFSIYGSAGKLLLFSILTFFLFTKQKVLTVDIAPFSKINALWAGFSALSLGIFFLLANQLLQFQTFSQAPLLALATHAALLASGGAAVLAVFGWAYLHTLSRKFLREALFSALLALTFYFLFSFVYQLWPYLSAIVLWAVSSMLRLTISNVLVVPPLTIQVPQFAVTIGEYCSGIESLFLITVLYIMIGILEWSRLKKIHFVFLYLPLICGQFFVNIIRVYVIIQSGILFSPEIAAKLFHTYLGIILFMGYFVLCLRLLRPLLFRKIPEKDSI